MDDGDHHDTCCCCGTEFLVRSMRQVTYEEPCCYMCVRCFDDTLQDGTDGLDDDFESDLMWQDEFIANDFWDA